MLRQWTIKKYPILIKCKRCGEKRNLRRHHPKGLEKWDVIEVLCCRCHHLAHHEMKKISGKTIKEEMSQYAKIEMLIEHQELKHWIADNHPDLWFKFRKRNEGLKPIPTEE